MQNEKIMRKLTFIAACLLVIINLTAQIAPTPAKERMKGLEKKSALVANSIINQVIFRNVGPGIMSGRVVDLAVKLIITNKHAAIKVSFRIIFSFCISVTNVA
ncbi:hypothetical protein AH06_01525 [candidate division TM6 bacterium Zodletone_IIa]|nr:hypothetical protein AH06_01525 [candidate division TM6 bacterium Zodletone_IIa]